MARDLSVLVLLPADMERYLTVLFALSASCSAICPSDTPCYRKCCPHGEMINKGKCVPGGSGVTPPDGFEVIYSKPDCDMYYLDKSEEHTIHENGTATYYNDITEYCVEWNNLNDSFTYVCFPPEDELIQNELLTLQIYSVGLWVSFPFLLATFLVYAILKGLKGLHASCVVNHTFSMLMAYVCLGIVQNKLMEENPYCTLLGKI